MLFCRPGTQNKLLFVNAKPNSNSTNNHLCSSDIIGFGKVVEFRQHSNLNSNSVIPLNTSSKTNQITMPECWTESRLIQLAMVQVVNYHMHFLVAVVSENQLHSAASTPQLACWRCQRSLHQYWNSPENNTISVSLKITLRLTFLHYLMHDFVATRCVSKHNNFQHCKAQNTELLKYQSPN